MTAEEFVAFKRRVEQLSREADRAEGAHEAALARLREEHGCDGPDEADELVADLERKHAAACRKTEVRMKAWEEKFGDKLEGE